MEDLHILRVDEINGHVGTGICEPLFAKIRDTNVVVKTYNNIESNRILANELIGFKIAKILNLPIPEAGLCIIDNKTTMANDFLLDDECYGIGFYSTRINKVTRAVLTSNIIQNFITNKEDIFRIILFDHLICNKDRHRNNFLLELGGDKRIIIIDHSHIFNLGPLWDQYQLQRFINEKDYLNEEVLLFNKSVYEIFFESMDMNEMKLLSHVADFEQKLNENIFNSIIYDLPDEWGINNNDKDKLIEYLTYRLVNLKTMCFKIANYTY